MMSTKEMEQRLNRLTENQIVQGELLGRLEQVVARHDEAIARNEEAIARNEQAIAHVVGAVGKITDGVVTMQAAMEQLFVRMDGFIRGLESNGRKN